MSELKQTGLAVKILGVILILLLITINLVVSIQAELFILFVFGLLVEIALCVKFIVEYAIDRGY